MRKFLFILTLLLAAKQIALAQKVRFTNLTNHWAITRTYFDGNNTTYSRANYQYTDSVLLNGYVYHTLVSQQRHDSLLIREDTVAGKVYAISARSYYGGTTNNEIVLYDYNLVVGDTFSVATVFGNQNNEFKWVVDSVITTSINGTNHKVFYFDGIPGSSSHLLSFVTIEGIGATLNPVFPIYGTFFEEYNYLACFSTNQTTPPVNPQIDWFNNTTSCTLSVPDVLTKEHKVSVAPQPAQDMVTFNLPETFTEGEIIISDLLGRTVYSRRFNNSATLQVTNTAQFKGIGVYVIVDKKTGKKYTGKVVFE